MSNTPKTALIISILWPSFLTACGATAVFFTLFDPWSLQVPPPLDDLSRIGAYTVGFFSILVADSDNQLDYLLLSSK